MKKIFSLVMVLIFIAVNSAAFCSASADEVKQLLSGDGGQSRKIIDVQNIMQYPELPTGCESVSLTILLNHLGYKTDKMTIVREYLPKLDFYWINGVWYGADFHTTFAGNPESEYAYGCYAPCIKITADSYFKRNGIDNTANDITGTSFANLLIKYIDNDIPVLIWITSSNLHEPYFTDTWTTPKGEKVTWLAYEHCVVLTGYDLEKQLVYVSDPLVGNTSYNLPTLRERYNQLGKQAVYIQPEKAEEPEPEPKPEPDPEPKKEPEQPDEPTATPDLAEPIYGDVDRDGTITSADSLLILRQSVGLENFNELTLTLADVDNDKDITSSDALEVLRYSVQLPSENGLTGIKYPKNENPNQETKTTEKDN